ncbi:MAG: hypothetical protein GX304_04720 [Clostridiales bacterium]|nr:hypothetical protein [Clostridiales bacterium]
MNKTKKIALSAMLVALSVLYIWVMTTFNFKVDLGFWSFTPLSHVFLMLGALISPYVGVFATIGTAIAFISTGNIITVLRAASHIFFVLLLIVLQKKLPLSNIKNMAIVSVAVGAVHSLFEILAVYAAVWLSLADMPVIEYILISCGAGTFIHSNIDFFAAIGLRKALVRAKVLEA